MSALPVVLVLASGRGTRFTASGGEGAKLQALLAGRPVLQWTVDAVRRSGLPWHLEQGAHAGMGDSIAAAVRAHADAPGWLILPGDLPLVRPETLRQVAARLNRSDAIVAPIFEARRGHPVGFGADYAGRLVALQGARGAGGLLAGAPVELLAVDDPGVVTDIDTLDDLRAAENQLASRRS